MTKFKAAIFDWAGTTVDFGSFAPMGAAKWNHIHALLQMPRIMQQRIAKTGHAPTGVRRYRCDL
jgi:phosphonoacetaldehyde hydrolase